MCEITEIQNAIGSDPFGGVINHLGDEPPEKGWISPNEAAETVFRLQRYTVTELCGVDGRLRFSVEIFPSVLMVHVHHRILNGYTTSRNPSLVMAIARQRENDHVVIARQLDKAFHLFKHQVEHIDASPSEARRQKSIFEASLNRTIQQLLDENKKLDREGGPHEL